MSNSLKVTSSGSNGLSLISFIAGITSPVAIALSWLITYSPLTLEAYTSLQTILDTTLDIIGVIAGLTALFTGIIALVRAGHYPRGKAHLGYAIFGVIVGGLEVVIFLLIAFVLFEVATHP